MAYVRDSDTSLWLHNKLGTSNDLWSGSSICSQLNQDVLRNIRDCFIDLQSQVKLKLLLAFLHIPRRNVEEWKVELEEVIEVASADNDQWVSMLAELLKNFPSTGNLNFQIEENAKVFSDLIGDVRKIVRKYADQAILPLECLYLNRNSFNAMVGHQPQQAKHFALKRKPKSAALRAELLQKSADASQSLKKNTSTPSVPIRCRGISKVLSDSSPFRGSKSSSLVGGPFRSPVSSGRSSLGIRPSPLNRPNQKKDGGIKLLDITEQPQGYGRDAKRRKKTQENEGPDMKKDGKEGASPTLAPTSTPTTPDYAAGLLSSTQLSGTSATPSNSSTINYAPPAPSTGMGPSVFVSEVVTPPSPMESPPPTHTTSVIGGLASMGGTTVPVQAPNPPPQPTNQVTQPAPSTQKKGPLQLSREQMKEAQEMFLNSNTVTRPEKALILGFMAGSRENPCPQLGNIVTIKLSENREDVVQLDGLTQPVVVETHFQMNYSTGEWKRVKKFRKAER